MSRGGKVAVFSGTSQGRELAAALCPLCGEVWVSVATGYGRALQQEGSPPANLHVVTGPMDAREMAAFLREGGFSAAVDATHPYARLATAEIRAACERTGVSLLRLLRPASQIEGAVRVSSCQTAAEFLADEGGNVLLATGAKELSAFGALDKNRLYVRVLPTHEGLSACERLGLPHSHTLALQALSSALGPIFQGLSVGVRKP